MLKPQSGHLLQNLPDASLPEELTDILAEFGSVRIERIVSTGQTSPEGFWYDQAEHEFVCLMSGHAALRFEEESAVRELTPGSWVHIPPHCRHRVEFTAENEPTVWLAVFIAHPL